MFRDDLDQLLDESQGLLLVLVGLLRQSLGLLGCCDSLIFGLLLVGFTTRSFGCLLCKLIGLFLGLLSLFI